MTAQESGRVAYLQAYAVSRDAVFSTADTFFTNAYTVRPSLRIRNASYEERTALEAERVALADVFETWEVQTQTPITDEELDATLKKTFDTLERVRTYIATLQTLVSKQEIDSELTATEKSAQEAVLTGTRTGIDATKGALTGALASITQARTEVLVSGETERTVSVGARNEDIALAEASVAQARGSVQSAEATLAFSQIRTPIAGTISTLSISRGDFVSGQQPVGVVANKNTQEVEVYVSDSVRERVREGMSVIIKGTERGTVSNVSPGLDPISKKARILIRVTGDATLVQGAFVEVAFIPDTSTQTLSDAMYVPLSAIKVTENGLAVFTVDGGGVLTAIPITVGPLRGTQMRIREGITPETRIVEDVRGLRAGDVVQVARADGDTQ
jgi:RND family efflux transporter MFP subunit